MKIVPVLILILSAALIVPISHSYADAGNQTSTNQTNTSTNQTNTTNQTSIGNLQNIGQEISNFIQQANILFKQQKNETLAAIKDCRAKMQSATPDNKTQIKDECQATMKSIREKYQDARNEFQQIFKQFRDEVIVLRDDVEGKHVTPQEKETSINHINDKAVKNGLHGINMTQAKMNLEKIGENKTRGIDQAPKHVDQDKMQRPENKSMGSDNAPPGGKFPQENQGLPGKHPG